MNDALSPSCSGVKARIIYELNKHYMKHLTCIVLFVLFIIMTSNTYAQGKVKTDSCYAGVYITYDDFMNNRLSRKVNLNSKGNSFGVVLASKTIKIVNPDTTVKFSAGSIYGYFECGRLYRYSPDTELLSPEDYYKIEEMGSEESGKLVIYTSVFYGGTEHFFSTGLNSPIHRLNINHLKDEFGEIVPEFIKAVRKMISENHGDIAAKDSHGNFLVNKIYHQFSFQNMKK